MTDILLTRGGCGHWWSTIIPLTNKRKGRVTVCCCVPLEIIVRWNVVIIYHKFGQRNIKHKTE